MLCCFGSMLLSGLLLVEFFIFNNYFQNYYICFFIFISLIKELLFMFSRKLSGY